MKSPFLAIAILSSLFSQAHARCRTFTPTYFEDSTDYVYTLAGQTYRASAIVNCSTAPGQTLPGSVTSSTFSCTRNQCLVQTPQDWTIRLNRTINVEMDTNSNTTATISTDLQSQIFNLATRYFGDNLDRTDFNDSKIWTVSQTSGCINETMAGYWGYSPIYNCVRGTLTECTQPDEALSGTNLSVCGVRTIGALKRQADADVHFVYASGVSSALGPMNATGDVNGASGVMNVDRWVVAGSLFSFTFVTLMSSGPLV